MKLLHTTTSPFARKVRVVARALQIEMEEVVVDPLADDPVLLQAHPIGRVPALVTDEGTIHDSRVICAYLDGLVVPTRSLRPPGWSDTVLEATADALLDAAVAAVMERRRPESEQSPAFAERMHERMLRIVESLPLPDTHLTLGKIAMACALGYLDFRHPNLGWRQARQDLAAWWDPLTKLPSFAETAPPAA